MWTNSGRNTVLIAANLDFTRLAVLENVVLGVQQCFNFRNTRFEPDRTTLSGERLSFFGNAGVVEPSTNRLNYGV